MERCIEYLSHEKKIVTELIKDSENDGCQSSISLSTRPFILFPIFNYKVANSNRVREVKGSFNGL